MNQTNNIFLIGFMGSGKTTLGKRLAKKLGKVFFDLDTEIEKEAQMSVDDIFEKEGEAYFRKLETQKLLNLIQGNENFVLSLGGGTPCFHQNIEVINQSGISIYLKYNAGILTSRLLNAKTKRPLIKKFNEEELTLFIREKLSEREPFYAQSKFVVEKNNVKIEDLIKIIPRSSTSG